MNDQILQLRKHITTKKDEFEELFKNTEKRSTIFSTLKNVVFYLFHPGKA